MVRDISKGPSSSSPFELTRLSTSLLGSVLVFAARDKEHGYELWASAGSKDSTRLLRDFVKGPKDSSVGGFTPFGRTLYFRGQTKKHGLELWRTDGTRAGTVRVADLNPGKAHSGPQRMGRVGDRLFFSAYRDDTGVEPFVLVPTISIGDVRRTEGDSDRTFRFNVTLEPKLSQTVTVDYATSPGTSTADVDYDSAFGTITFTPGETTKFVEVTVHGDKKAEPNERFFVSLLNPSVGKVADPSAKGTIVNDD
jgi:ELWxxDGT repeat protein